MRWNTSGIKFRRGCYEPLIARFDGKGTWYSPRAMMTQQAMRSSFRKLGEHLEAKQCEVKPDGMKTWYGVVSTFDNRGRVTAAVTRIVQAVERPEREYKSTIRKDIYLDWFDTREEADHFVAESKKA